MEEDVEEGSGDEKEDVVSEVVREVVRLGCTFFI